MPSSGTVSFDLPINVQAPPVDGVIVGTATSSNGDTSEFSGCSSFHRPVANPQTVSTTQDPSTPLALTLREVTRSDIRSPTRSSPALRTALSPARAQRARTRRPRTTTVRTRSRSRSATDSGFGACNCDDQRDGGE